MIEIDWVTRIIFVPQSYLQQVTPTVYNLDVNNFRLDLKRLESDSNQGIAFLDTHRHNTSVSLSGLALARVVEIINNYRIEFESGPYSVNMVGGNSNIGDVSIFNQVRVNANNSVGLQIVSTGSGLSTEQADQLTEISANTSLIFTIVTFIRKYITNRTKINTVDKSLTLFDDDGTSDLLTHDLRDRNGQPSIDEIHERIPR